MGKLSWWDPTGLRSENSCETAANPALNGYSKNLKSPENTPKNAKKQQSTETKGIVNTKIQAR